MPIRRSLNFYFLAGLRGMTSTVRIRQCEPGQQQKEQQSAKCANGQSKGVDKPKGGGEWGMGFGVWVVGGRVVGGVCGVFR